MIKLRTHYSRTVLLKQQKGGCRQCLYCPFSRGGKWIPISLWWEREVGLDRSLCQQSTDTMPNLQKQHVLKVQHVQCLFGQDSCPLWMLLTGKQGCAALFTSNCDGPQTYHCLHEKCGVLLYLVQASARWGVPSRACGRWGAQRCQEAKGAHCSTAFLSLSLYMTCRK